MKLYAAYPMTPTSPILHYLAKVQRDSDIVVFQPESELSAMNLIVGASYAGVRAMTGTSGGGFCLMSEAFGMAGMTESPVVVVLGMRPGPSTGLATRTSQTELRFALHASQGEFPRIVVAPGDPEECFRLTFDVFNLAERFQVPAIILTDKYGGESYWSIPSFDTNGMKIDRGKRHTSWKGEYKRYGDSRDGVSSYVVPGTKGVIVKSNSNSHNEWGNADEGAAVRTKSIDRWVRKLERMYKEITPKGVKTYGPKKADVTLLGWGSTKAPILEAIRICQERGVKVNFIQVVFMMPFPSTQLKPLLAKASKTLIIENNQTSQLGGLLKEALCFQPTQNLLKDDGRPFYPEDIVKKVEVMARGK
jgi:2-oxoglutarate ferredoxin oxidoreductase subunit alpha